MLFRSKSSHHHFQTLSFVFIILNIIVFLYFIFKLEQIESLTRETQAKAQELINTVEGQRL